VFVALYKTGNELDIAVSQIRITSPSTHTRNTPVYAPMEAR